MAAAVTWGLKKAANAAIGWAVEKILGGLFNLATDAVEQPSNKEIMDKLKIIADQLKDIDRNIAELQKTVNAGFFRIQFGNVQQLVDEIDARYIDYMAAIQNLGTKDPRKADDANRTRLTNLGNAIAMDIYKLLHKLNSALAGQGEDSLLAEAIKQSRDNSKDLLTHFARCRLFLKAYLPVQLRGLMLIYLASEDPTVPFQDAGTLVERIKENFDTQEEIFLQLFGRQFDYLARKILENPKEFWYITVYSASRDRYWVPGIERSTTSFTDQRPNYWGIKSLNYTDSEQPIDPKQYYRFELHNRWSTPGAPSIEIPGTMNVKNADAMGWILRPCEQDGFFRLEFIGLEETIKLTISGRRPKFLKGSEQEITSTNERVPADFEWRIDDALKRNLGPHILTEQDGEFVYDIYSFNMKYTFGFESTDGLLKVWGPDMKVTWRAEMKPLIRFIDETTIYKHKNGFKDPPVDHYSKFWMKVMKNGDFVLGQGNKKATVEWTTGTMAVLTTRPGNFLHVGDDGVVSLRTSSGTVIWDTVKGKRSLGD